MPSPHVTLDPAALAERPVLENLLQFYMYDFSEMLPAPLQPNGRFAEHAMGAYWQEDWRHPFLIHANGELAGFALVHTRSRLTGADGIFDMAEFFVARAYRRQGVGQVAAHAAFDRFAGHWEVRQRTPNVAATAFWRRTIDAYTRNTFTEVTWNDPTIWTGPVQSFSSR